MAFWSSETMRRRIRSEQLVTPYDEDLVTNCAYELRMGPEAHLTGEHKNRLDLAEREQLRIAPGHFAQLLTEETVRMPDDAVGLISMKSGLKLRGLVNVSGFHVDPGYNGQLLFSVYNAGPSDVVVSRGTPTFLMWLVALDQSTGDLYKGQRGNHGISDDDIMRLQGDVYTPHVLASRLKSLEDKVDWKHQVWQYIVAALIGVAATLGVSSLPSCESSDDPIPASGSHSTMEIFED